MEQDKWTFSLQICFDAWRDWINEAEHEGKGTFIKEHVNWMVRPDVESHFLHGDHNSYSNQEERGFNPTCIPDHFLLSNVRPTFLIRHPALTFPSLILTAIDNEGIDALLTSYAEKHNTLGSDVLLVYHTLQILSSIIHVSMPVEMPECHVSNHTRRVRSVQIRGCAEVCC
jgi:hypothetical protein